MAVVERNDIRTPTWSAACETLLNRLRDRIGFSLFGALLLPCRELDVVGIMTLLRRDARLKGGGDAGRLAGVVGGGWPRLDLGPRGYFQSAGLWIVVPFAGVMAGGNWWRGMSASGSGRQVTPMRR